MQKRVGADGAITSQSKRANFASHASLSSLCTARLCWRLVLSFVFGVRRVVGTIDVPASG